MRGFVEASMIWSLASSSVWVEGCGVSCGRVLESFPRPPRQRGNSMASAPVAVAELMLMVWVMVICAFIYTAFAVTQCSRPRWLLQLGGEHSEYKCIVECSNIYMLEQEYDDSWSQVSQMSPLCHA